MLKLTPLLNIHKQQASMANKSHKSYTLVYIHIFPCHKYLLENNNISYSSKYNIEAFTPIMQQICYILQTMYLAWWVI